mmetsp:Transcript_2297/g.3325  ORF Transcript_2297/g.3325 Transcript_2297/m.3325 type:complete len:153 (-) Transcript_2297:661-1119(-)
MGKRLDRNEWTPLPMPDEVIKQVHRMARRAKSCRTLTVIDGQNNDILNDDIEPEQFNYPDAEPEIAGVDNIVNNRNNQPDELDSDDETYHRDGNENESDNENDDDSQEDDENDDEDDNDANENERESNDNENNEINEDAANEANIETTLEED